MSLLGFRASNHPQQTNRRGARADIDDRATAPEVFAVFHERFRFTIDVCALPHNAKLPRFYTPEDNGLLQDWKGERVWCNPPFSDIRPWVEKAHKEIDAEVIVMLVPANRTEQRWWQELIEPHRDWAINRGILVEFLPGRMRFIRVGSDSVGKNERPPFGCCLLIWNQDKTCVQERFTPPNTSQSASE